MGKKRITAIDDSSFRGEKKEKVKVPGMRGGEKLVTIGAGEIIETPQVEVPTEEPKEEKVTKVIAKKPTKTTAKKRGKRYLEAKEKITPGRLYSLKEAIPLAKETSVGKFDGSLEAHITTVKTGLRGEVELPHFKSKAKRVAVATKELLAKVDQGKIDFDVLLASPDFMPQLVKYAKVLGPRGLMPNPKNGTIVQDPEKAIAQFQKESFAFKTEPKAPLIHAAFGKMSQKDEELEANLKTLLNAIGIKNIKRMIVKSSMGPAMKVNVQ